MTHSPAGSPLRVGLLASSPAVLRALHEICRRAGYAPLVHATHPPRPAGGAWDDRLNEIRRHAPASAPIIAPSDRLAARIAPLRLDVLLCHGHLDPLPPGVPASTVHGVVNLHPGDLPPRPGIGAVASALLRGDPTIRATAHLVTAAPTPGPILARSEPVELPDWFDPRLLRREITTATLHLAPRALDVLATAAPVDDRDEAATTTGTPARGLCLLDLARGARDIHHQARMLHYLDWPALANLDDGAVRVFRTRLTPGAIRIPCATGRLWADQVIPLDPRPRR
ncbi:hypothetical protein [Embleya sp. NPDC020630]|uniref:hypothetical protein n=1 Tax=Embleya sp. NPDC020630 TaxID=3363979 RepID=UPI0037AAA7A4